MSSDIGEFLRARRARVAPESRGLPVGDRRRVPGLRREELALLAGVSPDYYVRLEQGRAEAVSGAVLDAIGRALGLDDTELAHLYLLARPRRDRRDMRPAEERPLRPAVARLVHGFGELPAFAVGRRQRVLEANPAGWAVLPPSFADEPESSLRHLFLSPEAREYYVDWLDVAKESVAYLREEFGQHQGDRLLAKLVDDLNAGSPEFRDLWARHDVQAQTHGLRRLRLQGVGLIMLEWETLAVPDGSGVYLIVYAPHSLADARAITTLLLRQDRQPDGG